MDLILWRHAQAADGEPDVARELTREGRRQAERVAAWLRARLPANCRVLASPAVRTRQTADALGVAYRTSDLLLPGADVSDYLVAIGWPEAPGQAGGTVVVVGHQPVLGRLASLLLAGAESDRGLGKGAVCWLSSQGGGSGRAMTLKAAISPEDL